jgi:hypothetical protein
VDPAHAPFPRSPSERIVFRHLYQTLIRVDCAGAVLPGLAASWTGSDGGLTWTFLLREDARFRDGSPVRAADVIASWTGGTLSGDRPWGPDPPESLTALGDRRVRVTFSRASADVPAVFADPGLSVARREGSTWAMGTTGYRADAPANEATGSGAAPRDRVTLSWLGPGIPPGPERIQFEFQPASDARDLVDQGFDVLVSRDVSVLRYVLERTDYDSWPLPWDRTYVLLVHALLTEGTPEAGSPRGIPASVARTLAGEAVRAEARPPRGPRWWERADGCFLRLPAGAGVGYAARWARSPEVEESRTLRIAFRSDDPTARDLSERLVALTGPGSARGEAEWVRRQLPQAAEDSRVQALGHGPSAFARALGEGSEAAYVIALPDRPSAPCEELGNLVASAGWLGLRLPGPERSGIVPASRLDLGQSLVSLVQTRSRLILRGGTPPLLLEGDGTLVYPATSPGVGTR